MEIDYSVVIRTTGQAGEKYQALLDSIEGLYPRPVEVIVVLPEGYELPKEKLGYERFCFSPKGMVIQRMEGVAQCKTRYALVCDDDVKFDSDFVNKLYAPIKEGVGFFSAGPLYSFLPSKGLQSVVCTLMGSAMPTIFHKNDRYVSVLKSTGYSYNRHLKPEQKKYYESQSLAWTCFFADIEVFRKLKLEDEKWLDAHGYSAMDDQTMFYKAWLMGYKTIVVADAYYEHLDGQTSTRNNKPAVLYSLALNRVVFWHRFIYCMQSNMFMKGMARVAFGYRTQAVRLWDYISVFRHRMSKEDYQITRKGYRDGWKYICSEEYKTLPPCD